MAACPRPGASGWACPPTPDLTDSTPDLTSVPPPACSVCTAHRRGSHPRRVAAPCAWPGPPGAGVWGGLPGLPSSCPPSGSWVWSLVPAEVPCAAAAVQPVPRLPRPRSPSRSRCPWPRGWPRSGRPGVLGGAGPGLAGGAPGSSCAPLARMTCLPGKWAEVPAAQAQAGLERPRVAAGQVLGAPHCPGWPHAARVPLTLPPPREAACLGRVVRKGSFCPACGTSPVPNRPLPRPKATVLWAPPQPSGDPLNGSCPGTPPGWRPERGRGALPAVRTTAGASAPGPALPESAPGSRPRSPCDTCVAHLVCGPR